MIRFLNWRCEVGFRERTCSSETAKDDAAEDLLQQPAIFGDEEFCETVEKDECGDCSDDKSGEDAEHEEDCGGPGVAVGQGSDDESRNRQR